MISTRIKVKVQSVKAIRDVEGRESYQIDFVEVRSRQQVMPGGGSKEYELRKLTMIFTGDELEAFKLKPYPNQLYELVISNGILKFKEI